MDFTVDWSQRTEGACLTVQLVTAAQDDFTIDQPEAELIWKPPHRRVDFLLTASPEPPERCPPPPELEHLQFGSAVDRLRREWTSAAAT